MMLAALAIVGSLAAERWRYTATSLTSMRTDGRYRLPSLRHVLAALIVSMAACQRLPTREELLAQLQIPRSTFAAEDRAVADTIRTRLPPGVSSARVIHVLDSLGFVPSDRFVGRPHYRFYRPGPAPGIEATLPYHESIFSPSRFVCDRAAIRMSFRFEVGSGLTDITASSSRGCI